jgi:hypothetical protein
VAIQCPRGGSREVGAGYGREVGLDRGRESGRQLRKPVNTRRERLAIEGRDRVPVPEPYRRTAPGA